MVPSLPKACSHCDQTHFVDGKTGAQRGQSQEGKPRQANARWGSLSSLAVSSPEMGCWVPSEGQTGCWSFCCSGRGLLLRPASRSHSPPFLPSLPPPWNQQSGPVLLPLAAHSLAALGNLASVCSSSSEKEMGSSPPPPHWPTFLS